MVLIISGNCYAEEGETTFLTRGIGNNTCGKFISESGWDHPQYYGYVNGFFTGISYAGDDVSGVGSSTDDMLLWIKNYCEDHPLKHLITAILKLRLELKQ